MAEKEVEDYIQVQRSLGVSGADIKKSLVSAGYDEDDFRRALARRPKRFSSGNPGNPGKYNPTTKHFLYVNIAIIIFFGGLFGYMTYDYNAKMNALAADQEEQMNELGADMASQIDSLSSQVTEQTQSLDSEIGVLQNRMENINSDLGASLQNYNYQSMNRDNALSRSIQAISSKSMTEIMGFSEQLETFREASVDFSQVIPKSIKAVVTIGKKGAGYFSTTGSGVVINSNGYIVTNYHVLDDLGQIAVKMHDGTDYSATIVGKNEEYDVALIKLITEKNTFDYLEWADSEEVVVGDHVIAVGNPVGFESTVTEGIISNTRRLITGNGEIYYLQTDVAINAGNSGGPLIDKDGKVVGIATLKYSRAGFEGLSFALRSNDVQGIVLGLMQEEI
ncbi:trypsin-like peptidase domain-containing protein [Candidatus Woesearchaeota archaeon]|nr:trypsin-like peptidase domain-containing protein [Candidatus Woesearchaeota archaeon]